MKSIEIFINEKLNLSPSSKLNIGASKFVSSDFPIKTTRLDGEKYLWFKWWEYLYNNGPTSKHDLLTAMHLKPTSYSTHFTKLSKRNIIIPLKGKDRGKLMAVEPQEWLA